MPPFDPDAAAAAALLADLRAALGDDAVGASDAERFAYSRDLWPRLTLAERDGRPGTPPLAVVRPRDEAAVLAVLRSLARHRCPVVPYGAGSGVCGGAAPLSGGVVVDTKRLDSIDEVASLQVTVGPGLVLLNLEQHLNDRGYTLGHFPSSIGCCTIGGCAAARGAGQLSSRYGKMEDLVTGLRIATPALGLVGTGTLDPHPDARLPDWSPLFVGSEGRFGVITALRLRVEPLAARFVMRGVRFPSVDAGLHAFRDILQSGLRPSVMRLYDPLDTWLALRAKDPASDYVPEPGAGNPQSRRRTFQSENASVPSQAPPKDAGTERVLGMVVSPGSFLDEARRGLGRLPGLGAFARRSTDRRDASPEGDAALRRATRTGGRRQDDAPDGFRGALLRQLAGWLGEEDPAALLRPDRLGVDKLLAQPALLNGAASLLPGRSLAILGVEGDGDAQAELDAVLSAARRRGGVDLGPGPGLRWFRDRYKVSFKLPKMLKLGAFADTMETAAPWTRVPALYRAVRRALAPHALVMAHFSHAWHEGASIYFTFAGAAPTHDAMMERYDRTWTAILEAAHDAGATLSHHHGVGVLKRDTMDREHGAGRVLWDASVRALDPDGVMNPGKVFGPTRPALPPPEPESPRAFELGAHEDGFVEAGVGWRGVELAAELHRRGHLLPPLGRDFLAGTVSDWLRSGAYRAHVSVHGAMDHPLVGVRGRLPDGRPFRSSFLPRSAAGPSWLPFALGDPSFADRATLRTLTPPILRLLGLRFGHMDAAMAALSAALRSGRRPLWGAVLPGADPHTIRDVFANEARPRDGGLVFLAFAVPDGFPQGAESVAVSLRAAGGSTLPEEVSLAAWEDAWACPAREGAAALKSTGPREDAAQIGRVRAVLPWDRATHALRAVETLTGGANRAVGAVEFPLQAGCTLEWRFRTSRAGETTPLLAHQVRETLRAMRAAVELFDLPGDVLPDDVRRAPSPIPDAARIREALHAALEAR